MVTCPDGYVVVLHSRTGGRMESLLILLLIANLAGLSFDLARQDRQEKHLSKSLEDQADHLSDQLELPL